MFNNKEMYLKMFQASEQAANILITAQRECEELYLNSSDPQCKNTSLPAENKKRGDEE